MSHSIKSRFVMGIPLAAAILSLAFVSLPRAQAAPMDGKMMKGSMMMPQTTASQEGSGPGQQDQGRAELQVLHPADV